MHTRFTMNWFIFFHACFMINGLSMGGTKSRPNEKLRIRRQVLINNVEKGVFHGETKFIDTDPAQAFLDQFQANKDTQTSEAIEAELAKRLGLSDALEAEERRKLLNKLYGGQDKDKTLIDSLYEEKSAEEQLKLLNKIQSEKERKEFLDIIQKQQEQDERKTLLNKIRKEQEEEERIQLINKLYGENKPITTQDELLKKIIAEQEAEERRNLPDKLYSDKTQSTSSREAILKRLKEDQEDKERKKLLNEIYSEARPLTTGDILNSPYLGDKRTLIGEIQKLTPPRTRVLQVRTILREMETILAQLIGLGEALSSMEREVMLKGIYDRTKFLQKKSLC